MPRPGRVAETLTPAQVGAAYLAACRAELQALKPGNVHVFADGHGMSVADFEASAAASAGAVSDPRASVGARVWRAVRRSRAVAGWTAFAVLDCRRRHGKTLTVPLLVMGSQRLVTKPDAGHL